MLVAQKTTIVKGTIKNQQNEPIENVSIRYKNIGTSSDKNGNYSIRIPLNKEVQLIFSHVSYTDFIKNIDAIIMGKNTYLAVLSFGIDWPYTVPVFVLIISIEASLYASSVINCPASIIYLFPLKPSIGLLDATGTIEV